MDPKEYAGLKWKIIATTLAFSLIPLLTLGLTMHARFSSTYSEKITTNLETMVDNKKIAIDLFLEERLAQLKNLANTHSFEMISQEQFLERLFDIVQGSSKSFIDLGVIDQEGNHVAYAGPYNLKGLNYRNEPWFTEAMVRGQYISDVFTGFRKFPHIIIAVTRREGNSRWILRATIDSEVFNSLVRRVQVGPRGDAFIINRNKILQTPARFGGPVLSQLDVPEFTFFSGTRVGTLDYKGQKMITGYSWLEQKNWLLVIMEYPEDELKSLVTTQSTMIFLMLAGMMVILLGTIMITRAIIARLIMIERKKAAFDANVLHSSKMAALGKLAAGVAHEINNPLTLIKEGAGWIKDLLSEEDPKKSNNLKEMMDAASKIEFHVERAKSVTHRLLGFGRRMEPVQENVDLNLLVDQTIKFLENEAFHRSITIEKDFDPLLPKTNTDISQIQQVILNILDNAIDAIDRNGTIRIRTGCTPGKEVFAAVTDSGAGIPKEMLDKIFDPFFTTKKVGEGTGLGLTIIYGIMEKMGGRIGVESEVGKGSTFTIYLPLR